MSTPEWAKVNYTKQEPAMLVCSSCGSWCEYPVTVDWWYTHTSGWHSLKHRIKRRLGK